MLELGPRLEQEGSRVDLAPGAFERFEDRLRLKRSRRKAGAYVVVLTICALVVVPVLLSMRERGSVSPITSPSPTTSGTGVVLPPGMYWTQPLTRSQLVATLRSNGFGTPGEIDRFFQDLGQFSTTVRFGIHVQADGIWNQFQQLDDSPARIAWVGAHRVTGPREITVLGYGCTITYDVSRRASQVVIRVMSDEGPTDEGLCGQRDLVAQKVIYETAPFHAQS